MKKLLFIFLLLSANAAYAADHYIRQGATGSGSGNDWTNAYTTLPTTLIRGDVYYIAGGSYPGKALNTAASGTLTITIKGATVAGHGTETGWNASYSVETTQATWTSDFNISTSYWVIDGSVGPTWSSTSSQYGFRFNNVAFPFTVFNLSSTITDFTIAHIAATAPSGDIEKFFLQTDNSTKSVNNMTISHNYIDGYQNGYWATSPGLTMANWTFEYNICLNMFSSTTNHGEWINNNFSFMTNRVTRFNWFQGNTGSDGTGAVVSNNNDTQDDKIYGNVFKDYGAGNGIITGTSAGTMINPVIYNNTFINTNSGGWIGNNVTGAIAYNNIIANQSATVGSTVTRNFNGYYNTTGTPSEANGQIFGANPFVNIAANNVNLLAHTTSGTALSSPYDIDAFNVLRVVGTWDRGALQIPTSDTVPPTVSSTVPASSGQEFPVGANITATFSEPLNAATVTTATASIKRTSDNAPVVSTVSYAGNTIAINPTSDLASFTQYTATLTTGIQDVAGNALVTTYTWVFTTAVVGDGCP